MDIQEQLKRVKVEKCKRSFYEFFLEFWGVVVPDTPLVDNWHIKWLCDLAQEHLELVVERKPKKHDIIINIPPGTSKSTIISVMFPVYCWVRKPSLKIITASYGSALSLENADKSRMLLKSDKFIKFFPEVRIMKEADTKSNYKTTAGGTRFVTSVEGSVIGMHGDILIWDDPIKAEDANSDTKMNSANYWLDKSFSTRKTDKKISLTIGIMQRIHEQDPTGWILQQEGRKVFHVCIPAIVTKDLNPPELKKFYVNGYFDPVRLDEETLAEQRATLGSFGYAGQMLQSPKPIDGGIWKREWFLGRFTLAGLQKAAVEANERLTWDFVIDSAFTDPEKKKKVKRSFIKNDPTGIIAFTIFKNKIYIRNITTVWKEFPDLVKWIPEYVKRQGYHPDRSRIWIEPKANSHDVVSTMTAGSLINIIMDESPKGSKEQRTTNNAPFVETCRILLLSDAAGSDAYWVSNAIDQITMFPNTVHDEEVDMINMIIGKVKSSGSLFLYAGSG